MHILNNTVIQYVAYLPCRAPRLLRSPLLRPLPRAPQLRAPQLLRWFAVSRSARIARSAENSARPARSASLRARGALRWCALRFAPRAPHNNTYLAKNVFLRLKIISFDFQ